MQVFLVLLERNVEKGYRILMEAKKKGILDVNLDLAFCYEHGLAVEKQCPAKDYELTKEAYGYGGLWASIQLAIYYQSGFGVRPSFLHSSKAYHFQLG